MPNIFVEQGKKLRFLQLFEQTKWKNVVKPLYQGARYTYKNKYKESSKICCNLKNLISKQLLFQEYLKT